MKSDAAVHEPSARCGEPPSPKRGWAVWVTGLPASGKSTITAALLRRLEAKGVYAQVLESDELRQVLTPQPTYSEEERDRFYAAMVYIGELLSRNDVNVIFDATGNRRAYRERARALIPEFIEVFAKCPLEVAMQRDHKGTYTMARTGRSRTVPGVQSVYEEPFSPEVTVESDRLSADEAAERILEALVKRGLVKAGER